MNSIKLFESKQIRSVWNKADQKWYFSVSDVVEVLTDSANVRDYIKKMRKREQALDAIWGTICPPLERHDLEGKSGKRVSVRDNFKQIPESSTRKRLKKEDE